MTPRYNSHDKDLPTIFKDIRQAKEGKARQTIEERRRENEERRKTFSKRLNFFKRNRQEDDSVDLDAEEAWIQSEIEKVRAGEIHKYDQTQFAQSESMEEDSATFYSDYNASEPEEPILDVDSYLLSAEQGEKRIAKVQRYLKRLHNRKSLLRPRFNSKKSLSSWKAPAIQMRFRNPHLR